MGYFLLQHLVTLDVTLRRFPDSSSRVIEPRVKIKENVVATPQRLMYSCRRGISSQHRYNLHNALCASIATFSLDAVPLHWPIYQTIYSSKRRHC